MTRILALAAALGLAACGGATTRLDLGLTSNDAAPAAAATVAAPGGPAADLLGVQAIRVTVVRVSVHVAATGAPDPAAPPAASDGPGWVVLSDKPKVYDLVALRSDFTAPLASGTVPAGKITQIRLALSTGGPETGEGATATAAAGKGPHDVIPGAVTETDGTVCDLLVPHSAFQPGIEIVHPFQALPLPASGASSAVVDLRVRDSRRESTPSGCAYRLNPVITVTGS